MWQGRFKHVFVWFWRGTTGANVHVVTHDFLFLIVLLSVRLDGQWDLHLLRLHHHWLEKDLRVIVPRVQLHFWAVVLLELAHLISFNILIDQLVQLLLLQSFHSGQFLTIFATSLIIAKVRG